MRSYKIEELVKVAKRDNNKIRPYLYVNPLQGKHISVSPKKSLELFETLAARMKDKHNNEKIMVIGFAETATAIGAGLAMYCDNVLYVTQTTREKVDGAEYLYFTESHSHAKEQGLIINDYSEVLHGIDRIVFAEDEVTTGNTIVKLIKAISDRFPDISVKYSIACILNSMQDERMEKLLTDGIDCVYVDRMEYEYRIGEINDYSFGKQEKTQLNNSVDVKCTTILGRCDLRKIQLKIKYFAECDKFINNILEKISYKNSASRVLVLGTEEFMFPAMYLGYCFERKNDNLKVDFHATTRSPILVSKDKGYPLFNRYELQSCYEEERKTYIYNLEKYDYVLIVTDSDINSEGLKQLVYALETEDNKDIEIVRWGY